MNPHPSFSLRTTPPFERLFKKLSDQHPDLLAVFESALAILHSDPYNVSRQHHIKKLKGIKPGEGQYRLRIGRWRFRYDMWGREVELSYCGLRREDTY